MKNFRIFAAVLALALSMGAVAYAQEDGNRDENGKIVRGPYLTNGFWDNWFIQLGGGIDLTIDQMGKNFNGKLTPEFDVNLGKWIDPCFGARLGFQGIQYAVKEVGSAYSDPAKNNNMLLHGDFLWNISNQFWGYKESRIYNCIPYLQAGLFFGKPGTEFEAGAGILNNFRFSPRLGAFIDARISAVRGEQFKVDGRAGLFSASLGLNVNLGKTNWKRSNEAALNDQIAALQNANDALAAAKKAADDENAALNDANKKLADENEALRNRPVETVIPAFEGPAYLYYEIGQTELSALEDQHLEYFANYILAKDEETTFHLTGSADKGTGSAKRNQYLADTRVNNVKEALISKYGISEDRIVVEPSVIADNDPALDRCVIINNK